MRVILPLIALVLTIALYFLLADNFAMLGPLRLAAVRNPLRLAAEAGIWLSLAWLAKSLLALAIIRYSRRRSRAGGATLLGGSVPRLLIDVGGLLIFLLAILGIVSYVFGRSLGGLLATSGVLAAIIGFAMQRMISDIFSGVALNIERSFAIGDWLVTATGLTGKVTDASWRAVHMVTFDGRAIVVPNSVLVGNQFTNLNAPERHFRMKETLCLEYSVPPERAIAILEAAIAMTEGVLHDLESLVLLDECADNGIVYSMNFWVPDYPESFLIARAVMSNALKLLDQVGLSPAYPKRDVALFKEPLRQIEYDWHLPAVLGRVPILKILDPETREVLGRTAAPQSFAAGAEIVREGASGASLYVVLSGVLSVTRAGPSGRVRTLGRLVAGDTFGEMSLLTGAPRSATVTAVTPVTLVEITKETLEPILARHPALITRLSEIQAARLASHADDAALTPTEQEDLGTRGFAEIMRARILRFFGQAAS